MTNKNVYAVYDTLAEDIAGQPFVMNHDAAAIRMFGDTLHDKASYLSQHPADYHLIKLGTIGKDDRGNLTITAADPSEYLVIAGAKLTLAAS